MVDSGQGRSGTVLSLGLKQFRNPVGPVAHARRSAAREEGKGHLPWPARRSKVDAIRVEVEEGAPCLASQESARPKRDPVLGSRIPSHSSFGRRRAERTVTVHTTNEPTDPSGICIATPQSCLISPEPDGSFLLKPFNQFHQQSLSRCSPTDPIHRLPGKLISILR
jgi:hypothetical protein